MRCSPRRRAVAQLDGARRPSAWEHELTRRQRLIASSDQSLQEPETFLLPLAADQFIVRPATRAVDDAQATPSAPSRAR